MAESFNFSNLRNIYLQALKSDDKSVAFNLAEAKGSFLFMMLLSEEDAYMRDALFVYMRRTNVFREFKTYGSHRNGVFTIYLEQADKKAFMDELGLGSGHGPDTLFQHLENMNNRIPQTLDPQKKIECLREGVKHVPEMVDDSHKTVFAGTRRLKKGRPQDKTLRKLYVHLNADYDTITRFISWLKERNMTVAWTTPDRKEQAADIFAIMNQYS